MPGVRGIPISQAPSLTLREKPAEGVPGSRFNGSRLPKGILSAVSLLCWGRLPPANR